MRQLVLNVDDFEPQLYVRSAALRAAGLEVVEARTGKEALAAVRAHHPAIVVLDIHLPDIDGFEVCRQIKAEPAGARTVVLHISARHTDAAARVQALENGADGYLTSEVEPAELVAHVRSLLRLANAEARAREVEEALRASEHRLRLAQDAGRVGVFDLDVATGEVVWSPQLERVYGITAPADPLARHAAWFQLVHPEDRERVQEAIERLFQPGCHEVKGDYRLVRPDGEVRWIASRTLVVRDERDRAVRVVGTNIDITDEKRAEQALRESEERLRGFFDASAVLMTIVELRDDDLIYVMPNARLASYFGLSAEEMRGKGVRELGFPDEIVSYWLGRLRECAAIGAPAVWEYELDIAGRVGWYQATVSPIPAGASSHPRFAMTIVDITEAQLTRRALEGALDAAQRREAEIESIYDSAPIGLCIFDREGRYLRINRRLAEINGPSAEAHVGRTLREMVPGIADQTEMLLQHVVATGQPAMNVEISGELPSRPGVVRTWSENWHPVLDERGEVVAVNVAAEEITRRKQIEAQLREANRLKDEFLATLSHELRTPLTAILGWAHMLERGNLSPEMTRKAVETISRNAHVQRQLVTDVLDVSRMISGKLRLQVQELDLMQVVLQAVESTRPAVEAKGLRLEVLPALQHTTVTADPDRLQQIVWNLLSNAVKFTPAGGRITIAAQRTESTIDLFVSDTGIGISQEFLPRVFDRFAQADASTSRSQGGLGLGLAIVRHLVEMHGGRISVNSPGAGRGATFTVSLPVRAVRRPSEPATVSPKADAREAAGERASDALAGVRVLVVDDLDDARELVAAVIEQAGGEVLVAASGEEAIATLTSDDPPHVVLADIGMPEMDGYEFVRRVRALPPEGGVSSIPVIALTAYGSAADRARALAAGFQDHLAKPVLPNELLAAVERVGHRHALQIPKSPNPQIPKSIPKSPNRQITK